jgi:hypothetical protein
MCWSAAALLMACAGGGVASAGGNAQASRDLMREFPGVRVHQDGVRTRTIYGRSMTTAGSPEAAADRFLATHGDAFGVGQLRLVQTDSIDMRDGSMHVFHYTQTLGGLAVELSPGRVLTRANGDGSWSVVYAAGLFASLPEGGFVPMTRTGQDAVNFVRSSEQFDHLPVWSGAELVVWQRQTETGFEGVRAWKFVGEIPDLVTREKYTFFVDAATGALLEARDEVHNIDVFGYAKGYGSPGLLPDKAGNAPVLMPLNDLRVAVTGGNNAYTDPAGFFNITHGGSSNVTITANFDTGQWCNINDQSGTAVQSRSATATPGAEAYLEFNSAPSQYLTAQVNGFVHTGLIHNFWTDYTSWTGMNFRCTTNVNLNSTCNAYFDGNSINFFRAGGGCNNTGFSTVVAHEYGHYVVARLGLAQGSFGEGFGDCCSEMLYDTGVVGEDFFTSGGDIRNNDNTVVQYPCGGEIHYCGQVLGGVWWHLRENMGASYGSAAGLELTRQLFADWALITTGGSGNNGAHPGTAVEVLTLDDDDGNIDNGTPHYNEIEGAFELHGIDVPDIIPLVFSYPGGLPATVLPAGGTSFEVIVAGNAGFTPEPGTGLLHFNAGAGYVAVPLTQTTDNHYIAEFPAIECRSEVSYYLSAESTDGAIGRDPLHAPADAYYAFAAQSRELVIDADFETDVGFTVENNNVSAGAWSRSIPSNNPTSDYDGSGKAYVTGVGIGNPDLDGGPTRLVSPTLDLAGLSDPYLAYARWFFNDAPQEGVDRLTVEVSDDGGASWVVLESVTNQGLQWVPVEYRLRDYIDLTGQVVVRFSAVDAGSDSEVEAGIDAVLLDDVVCSGCVADFNGDGSVNTQDVLAFLNAWSAGDSSADINGDGSVNTQDVLAFLNLYAAGC